MASLKGFLDWVKGEDMEEDYEEFVPRSQPAAAARRHPLQRQRTPFPIPQIHSVPAIK